jgi:F-type H+-transporting ATPase subunit b
MEFNATFIVTVISFVIFSIIMNAIFYKPLEKVVSEREKFIKDINEEAKANKKKSEAIIKDKEQKVEKAKQDARKIISEKSDEVKTQKSGLTSEAQQVAMQKVESAKADLEKQEIETQGALSEEAQKLALEISAKILGKV